MATHNGAKTLPQVLNAYVSLPAPTGGWKLVIVDNASTDETPQLLPRFIDQLPLVICRTEGRGKNLALNVGLNEVAGDLVILTDDDAVPRGDWLGAWRSVADNSQGFDIFGGNIEPIWPSDTPEWIPRLVNLGATYAITPSGTPSGPIPAWQVWGPNMAIRTSVFSLGHRFDETVGPQAGQYIMGSEVEFTCRLKRHGCQAWFAGEVSVGHIIRSHQIERNWIIQRGYRLGRHMFHQERREMDSNVSLWRGAPRWKYRQLASAYGQALVARLLRRQDALFRADWEISFLKGYIKEASGQQQS